MDGRACLLALMFFLFSCDGCVLFDGRPQATKIATAMVTQYGMSEKVGKVFMKDHQKEGPEMRAKVDSEVKSLRGR